MSLQYLEKIRSKLRSLTLTDTNRLSAKLAKRVSSKECRPGKKKQDEKNKSTCIENDSCWSSGKRKEKTLLKRKQLDEKPKPETEEKTVFTMTLRGQPSSKIWKRNTEKKVQKAKAKVPKVNKQKFANNWSETEKSQQLLKKINKKGGLEKSEAIPLKEALQSGKNSKGSRKPKLCDCGETRDVSFVVKDFCSCEREYGNKIDLRKLYTDFHKRKPKTAPHLTDSLIVYKKRFSQKSDFHDKSEDEAKESPVKKKGKGVSFSKDVLVKKRNNEEGSLITLFQNSVPERSELNLTKEYFDKIKSSSPDINHLKRNFCR